MDEYIDDGNMTDCEKKLNYNMTDCEKKLNYLSELVKALLDSFSNFMGEIGRTQQLNHEAILAFESDFSALAPDLTTLLHPDGGAN